MTTIASSRKAITITLDAIIRFDNKAILSANNSEEACKLAEHTLARLEQLKAPRRYFELVLRDALMKRKEMQKRWYLLMHDKSVIQLATRFGIHATTKTKEQLIAIANYFESYRLSKETVRALRNGPMTATEFLSLAACYHVSSPTMDETAGRIISDAQAAHGKVLGQKVHDVLQKRYDDWNDLPDI